MNLIRSNYHYSPLVNLTKQVGLVALDVGARKGINTDLLPLAEGINCYGFEPDQEECVRLNKRSPQPWKSVSYIPMALGQQTGSFYLNLYRQRGCSSKLHAHQNIGKAFSREEYFIHDGTVSVPTAKLDDVLEEYQIRSPAFMKIDVQGMEVEVFQGSKRALSESLVGIRSEVGFIPLYDRQPLFKEVDQTLRPYGFVPTRFLEVHEWRRTTRFKLPRLGPNPMPYSKGQIVHGDLLYLLQPEALPAENDDEIRRLIRLALIAVCYDLLDYALAVFERSPVRECCHDLIGKDPILPLYQLSKMKSRRYKSIYGMLQRICRKLV